MVSRTPEAKYRRDMKRLRGTRDDSQHKFSAGNVVTGDDLADRDVELIEQFARAHDENDPTVATAESKSYNTLARYVTNLMRLGDRTELARADADAINHVTHQLHEDGRAKSTVRQIQLTARTFYRYHDLECDPDRITTFSRPDSSVDERDMLEREEIDAIEQAIDHPRDLAIFHLLLYTGQRVGALRTLRVKDVAPGDGPSGRYWINDDADGLKGVSSDARPLLGAQSSVRDWLKYHPTQKPAHYLITAKPKYNEIDPTEPVTNEVPRRMLKNIKDEIGLDKPLHPHAIRHNFVTICKRDYDMADEDIKHLLGHADGSTVMQTTYSHLSAEDHNERVEAAVRGVERESKARLTGDQCDTCGNNLEHGAKACSRCGAVFGPNAESVQNNAEKLVLEIENEDQAEIVKAILDDTKENPRDYVDE